MLAKPDKAGHADTTAFTVWPRPCQVSKHHRNHKHDVIPPG